MSTHTAPAGARRQPTAEEFHAMRTSPEFGQLRSAYRSFSFPMTVAFFAWYMAYVIAACFAPEFMGREIFGGFNVALLFGLLQFVTTFAITWVYVGYANRNIEPRAAAIRAKLEGTAVETAGQEGAR